MKKLIPFIALVPLVLLALTPPFNFQLDCTFNSLLWLWAVLASGFLSFVFMYQKVSVWLKLFVVWAFTSCFLSAAPYISFTMLFTVIACAYYYALCKKITDWSMVRKAIQGIFFLITLLIIMQLFGKDTLLNFNMKTPVILGTIGNRMILSSFVCVLAPFLIVNPLNWIPIILVSFISYSSGAVLAILLGLGTYVWKIYKNGKYMCLALIGLAIAFALFTGDFATFASKAGRRQVWEETIELTLKRPLGYGIATYRVLFPHLCSKEIRDQQPGREWARAHNDFLQIPFEVGIPGLILLIGWIVSIVRKVRNPLKLAGLAILVGTMSCQFPTRMGQSVLIILAYLAYCEHNPNLLED